MLILNRSTSHAYFLQLAQLGHRLKVRWFLSIVFIYVYMVIILYMYSNNVVDMCKHASLANYNLGSFV